MRIGGGGTYNQGVGARFTTFTAIEPEAGEQPRTGRAVRATQATHTSSVYTRNATSRPVFNKTVVCANMWPHKT